MWFQTVTVHIGLQRSHMLQMYTGVIDGNVNLNSAAHLSSSYVWLFLENMFINYHQFSKILLPKFSARGNEKSSIKSTSKFKINLILKSSSVPHSSLILPNLRVTSLVSTLQPIDSLETVKFQCRMPYSSSIVPISLHSQSSCSVLSRLSFHVNIQPPCRALAQQHFSLPTVWLAYRDKIIPTAQWPSILLTKPLSSPVFTVFRLSKLTKIQKSEVTKFQPYNFLKKYLRCSWRQFQLSVFSSVGARFPARSCGGFWIIENGDNTILTDVYATHWEPEKNIFI